MGKPSLPQGTRDFGPDTVRKRNYIFNTIKNVFELYGFQPLETPAMENIETLMGKYGEEGDKLIFKILNNGLNDPKNIDKSKVAFENVLKGKNDKDLTERALRYDLTIPFARYVAMNHNQLTFPFKRYQIQPVWRADRPQRGRYREFWQCDADVVGSNSLLNEVELIAIYIEVFKRLNIKVDIRINNRKILAAIAELSGGLHLMAPISASIDKLDKIGVDGVKEELKKLNLTEDQINTNIKFLSAKASNLETVRSHFDFYSTNLYGQKGVSEINSVVRFLINQNLINDQNDNITIDFTLARGLNYYTGIILEVRAKDIAIGSIGGGGRYDDLTGLFGVPNIPGVGISFGVDRIYDVMEELKLFPQEVHTGTQVLFFNLGENESKAAFLLMQELRAKGIRSELFHENSKFDKQFKYAEKKNIPYVIIIGDKELKEKSCTIKNLSSGKQETIAMDELGNYKF